MTYKMVDAFRPLLQMSLFALRNSVFNRNRKDFSATFKFILIFNFRYVIQYYMIYLSVWKHHVFVYKFR